MITHARLYDAEYINLQRLARFMKVDDSGEHDELVNRVFEAIMNEAPYRTAMQREQYERMWEQLHGSED